MNSPRVSPALVSVTEPVCGPCFHTDAAGNIPLTRNWPALLRRLSAFNEIAVQSRHTYARLTHLGPLPSFTWNSSGNAARDDSGSLKFDCTKWGGARAQLALCECCGSPGRIEIQNQHGAEFLQFCPMPATPPISWATCLADLLPTHALVPLAPGRILTGFNLLPDNTLPISVSTAALVDFLSRLVDSAVSLRCTLSTPEFLHQREFVPCGLEATGPFLIFGGPRVTVQLALPGVCNLALDAAGHALHVVGPGGILLLTLECARESDAWAAALRATFPAF